MSRRHYADRAASANMVMASPGRARSRQFLKNQAHFAQRAGSRGIAWHPLRSNFASARKPLPEYASALGSRRRCFPGLPAPASLKQNVVGAGPLKEKRFPGLPAPASLKRFDTAGMPDVCKGFPGLPAPASLKRRRRIARLYSVRVFRGLRPMIGSHVQPSYPAMIQTLSLPPWLHVVAAQPGSFADCPAQLGAPRPA